MPTDSYQFENKMKLEKCWQWIGETKGYFNYTENTKWKRKHATGKKWEKNLKRKFAYVSNKLRT